MALLTSGAALNTATDTAVSTLVTPQANQLRQSFDDAAQAAAARGEYGISYRYPSTVTQAAIDAFKVDIDADADISTSGTHEPGELVTFSWA